MAPHSILVIGLGELGLEVLKSLATHPSLHKTNLFVLLRSKNHKQLSQLKEWNVLPIYADLASDSQEQLSATFAPYHTIICCTGMSLSPYTQIKITKAVLSAKVKRYIPWQFGIDYDRIGRNSAQDLFDTQLDVRELLRGQTQTSWTIISTGMFISFLFEPEFGVVHPKGASVTALGSWDNEITVTSPEDIGKVTAELALRYEDVEGVVYVAGDTISMQRLADLVERLAGKTIVRELKSVEDLEQELAEDPEDSMKKYRVVFGQGVGVSWAKEESFNEVKGIATQSVEDWLLN